MCREEYRNSPALVLCLHFMHVVRTGGDSERTSSSAVQAILRQHEVLQNSGQVVSCVQMHVFRARVPSWDNPS